MDPENNLPLYVVPLALLVAIAKDTLKHRNVNKYLFILNELKHVDRLSLVESHYCEFLKLGLYLEQYQQIIDTKTFLLPCTNIYKVAHDNIGVRNKFRINVSNMNEDNPILNVSDSLKVIDVLRQRRYYVRVASVQKDCIIVIANKKFCYDYDPFIQYHVQLVANDYTYRCAHKILSLTNTQRITPYLFPCKKYRNYIDLEDPINTNERTWFNNQISENPEQKQAVINIGARSSMPAPYIVYGPPGTGKTSTIVEAICQIWQHSNEHILICAPSNAACDVVAERLLQYVDSEDVFRMYSGGRDWSTFSRKIKDCCNYDYEGFALGTKTLGFFVMMKRIVIATLASSMKLLKLNDSIKFSHIFIDEAGQATQLDALLSVELINVTSSTYCQIVVSGDPQQLGPTVLSKLAQPILGESILQKLMEHHPYRKCETNGYDPLYITKLIRNYRSSSEIIHVSNKLFYDSDLVAILNKKDKIFPILFHNIIGREQKVFGSTSSYNQMEINQVVSYVYDFINGKIGGKRFSQKEIGVITPFSLQSIKLRKELQRRNLSDVDVGTVEIFQGQEKAIIIISSVRSEIYYHQNREHIGFLSNPRRFNVALTRAKEFLVVVGNPNVLQVDKCWRFFIKYCKENKACRGDDFQLNEDVDQVLQGLNLGGRTKRSDELFEPFYKIFEEGEEVQMYSF